MRKILLIISIILGSPFAALAANIEAVDGANLVLPSDSSQYSLSGNFSSLEINNASFSFNLTEDSNFVEIVSPDKKNLDIGSSALDKTLTCRANDSVLRVNFGPSDTSQTVTITPSGTCGSSTGGGGIISSGGGGGGGGGGPAYEAAPSTQTVDKVALLKQQIAATQVAIAQKIAEKRVSVSAVFTRDLQLGGRGDEIKRLQELLASNAEIYPEGLTTGFYGQLTSSAVRRFQLKYGVIKNANELGNGRVGPKTRAKLNEIFGTAPATPATPATPAVPSQTPATPAVPATPAADAAKDTLVKSIQEQIKAIQAKLIQEQIKLIQEKINALKK